MPLLFPLCTCFVVLVWLFQILLADRVSLGLPVAYLLALFLIHVPGAFAYLVSGDLLEHSDFTETGIIFTAIGSSFFVLGVKIAHLGVARASIDSLPNDVRFWRFCTLGGWLLLLIFNWLRSIPSLAAIIDQAGSIWMLGVLLGLRVAVQRRDYFKAGAWIIIMCLFPAMTILLSGFISYASVTILIVCSGSIITFKNYWRAIITTLVAFVLGLNIFIAYFSARDQIRAVVWTGADMGARIDAVVDAAKNIQWFDRRNPEHLRAFDLRLNQNYFVGVSAARIEQGSADFLYGRSVWQSLLALIPRAIWTEKTVFGGSPEIVMEMTGLTLSRTTAWGVGNVMEFYINFGIPGLIGGFLLLGYVIGFFDRKAATALLRGKMGEAIIFFMPTVGLIIPERSMVEMAGGALGGLIAAYFWRWLWNLLEEVRPNIKAFRGRFERS